MVRQALSEEMNLCERRRRPRQIITPVRAVWRVIYLRRGAHARVLVCLGFALPTRERIDEAQPCEQFREATESGAIHCGWLIYPCLVALD